MWKDMRMCCTHNYCCADQTPTLDHSPPSDRELDPEEVQEYLGSERIG